MSESQQGVAKIFGISGGTMVTLTGAATITMDDADLEHNFDLTELENAGGDCETLIGANEKIDVTINFAPNGATRAAAATSAANSFPEMVTKVVLSSFAVAKFNGNYNYIGGCTAKATKKGVVMMGIKLRAYIANRASLTAGVIVG